MSKTKPMRLVERLESLGEPAVLVVGDVILDRYVVGAVERISPEAPIQVLAAQAEELRLGGAGNVARNVAAFGGRALLVGVVGEDPAGRELRRRLASVTGDPGAIVSDPDRPTIEKTRMIAHGQQVLRVDREDARPLEGEVEARVLGAARERLQRARVVVVSDYGKGTVTPAILQALVRACRDAGIPLLVDPKGRDFARYRGSSLLTPNRLEAEEVTGLVLDGEEALRRAGSTLVEDLDLQAVVITLGAGGIYLHPRRGEPVCVPAQAREVYDVTGAGDTVAALLGVAIGGGASLEEAVRLANAGAGIVVGRLGAGVARRGEVRSRLRGASPYSTAKEVDLPELLGCLEEARRGGKRIVFTNGCFDLVHAGHVHFLEFARSQGDLLVVAVNGDDSIRALKGAGRPIFTLRERVRVLSALEWVDYVIPFREETPLDLIETLRPDVLVKGADWKDKGVVGREAVEAQGGVVVLAPLLEEQSTSEILSRIRSRPPGDGGGA